MSKRRLAPRSDPQEHEADQLASQVMRGQRIDSVGASSSAQRHDVPASVDRVLGSAGTPLVPEQRERMEQRFGHDFSRVRVHSDGEAARSAREVNAMAYTVGNDIVFGRGQYTPGGPAGQHLLAHELAHVVQQSRTGAALQRKIDEAELPKKSAAEIMADDHYIDNDMAKLEYHAAQEATITYKDGSQFKFGLVPDFIKSPLQGVDFATASSEHIGLPGGPGQYRFIPRGRDVKPAPDSKMSMDDVIRELGVTADFRMDAASGRIFPTFINSRTAPMLCEMLRTCEAEYVATTDVAAQGGIKILKKLETILYIYLMRPGSTAAGGLARAGGMAAAERTLLQEFLALLRSGGTKAITVEGVLFDSVSVTSKGSEVVVSRFGINRVAGEIGHGRVMQAAYERAAIAAARQAGAKSARLVMDAPVNASWRTYMESQGYVRTVVETGGGGVKAVLQKIITL